MDCKIVIRDREFIATNIFITVTFLHFSAWLLLCCYQFSQNTFSITVLLSSKMTLLDCFFCVWQIDPISVKTRKFRSDLLQNFFVYLVVGLVMETRFIRYNGWRNEHCCLWQTFIVVFFICETLLMYSFAKTVSVGVRGIFSGEKQRIVSSGEQMHFFKREKTWWNFILLTEVRWKIFFYKKNK